jgi:hypothetical protein
MLAIAYLHVGQGHLRLYSLHNLFPLLGSRIRIRTNPFRIHNTGLPAYLHVGQGHLRLYSLHDLFPLPGSRIRIRTKSFRIHNTGLPAYLHIDLRPLVPVQSA